jgi:mono/diheme cytochrome c family protein
MLAVLLLMLLLDGDPERGRELFRSCSGCHMARAPHLESLFGKVTLRNGKRVNDENVREIVLDGFNGMPSFRYSFRAAEIDDLMAYLHTMKARPAENPAATGAAYFQAWCARCHKAAEFPEKWTADSQQKLDEGHAGTPPLAEWLDAPARKLLADFLAAPK